MSDTTLPKSRVTTENGVTMLEMGTIYRDGYVITVEWDEDENEWCAKISGLPDGIGATFAYAPQKADAVLSLCCCLASVIDCLLEAS